MPQSYTQSSPTGRVKRMTRRLEEAEKIYTEVVTIAAPQLQTDEGKEILAHSERELVAAWRSVCVLS